MRSKSSCSPGDAPSIHLPVHLPVHHLCAHHPVHLLCAHHLLLKQDLAVSRRPSRGRISKQNKRSKKSSWGCFCLRLNIRNPKTPENLTKHEFEIITRSWSKNRKTFERLRCSSATNLTIKPEIYDLQKGAGQPCKTFSPPHKRCFTVTNTTLKHRHSYPQIFHHMCIKMAVFSPSEI